MQSSPAQYLAISVIDAGIHIAIKANTLIELCSTVTSIYQYLIDATLIAPPLFSRSILSLATMCDNICTLLRAQTLSKSAPQSCRDSRPWLKTTCQSPLQCCAGLSCVVVWFSQEHVCKQCPQWAPRPSYHPAPAIQPGARVQKSVFTFCALADLCHCIAVLCFPLSAITWATSYFRNSARCSHAQH